MVAKKTVAAKTQEAVAQEIEGFIDKFEPAMAKQIREVRAAVKKRLPGANELVWDNYNFFVLGYSPTERPSDSWISLAANAKGVGLCFYWGSELPDPHGMLEGSGSQNRFVRLVDGVKTLKDTRVDALIQAAVDNGEPMPKGKGVTVVRSVAAKQRPRR